MNRLITIISTITITIVLLPLILTQQSASSNLNEIEVLKQLQKFQSFKSCLPQSITIVTKQSSQRFNELLKVNYNYLNAFNRKPTYITLPKSTNQVSQIIACASKHRLKVCARSGGHSYIGSSICKGVLIDMSLMRSVTFPFKSNKNLAVIESGATLGEALYHSRKFGKWFAGGVCPGVGMGGFVLGGGIGPYQGRLGLMCDSIVKYTFVNRFGKIKNISRGHELQWGLCGVGGGQLGIVTQFIVRVVPSKYYDNSVIFRFKWKYKYGVELIQQWMKYNEDSGKVWARLEIHKKHTPGQEDGIFIFGSCYNVVNTKKCLLLLKRTSFYNVRGRKFRVFRKVNNVLHVHAFYGPNGGWGRRAVVSGNKIRNALLSKRYSDKGEGNEIVTQTSFLSFKNKNTTSFWKQYVQLCSDPVTAKQLKSLKWTVCMMNLFNNRINAKNKQRQSAFPHRSAHIISEYIIAGDFEYHRKKAYWSMKQIMSEFEIGVYVNYAERLLPRLKYPTSYWGSSLRRLRKLKRKYDPTNFFSSLQPIPIIAGAV